MTVTRHKKRIFPNPSFNSSTESLHLYQSSSSSEDFPTVSVYDILTLNDLQLKKSNAPKHTGRRKLRRHLNHTILESLQDFEESDVIYPDFHDGPFTRLIRNCKNLTYWNQFINMTESEQNQLLNTPSSSEKITERTSKLKSRTPFGNISSRIRRMLKMRKNLSMSLVRSNENDIINFFVNSPMKTFVKCPMSGYEKLLLHAIAQYHCLKSISTHNKNEIKVEIFNSNKDWDPLPSLLQDCINHLRKN
ncbi:hypothetical protein HHI36_005332 [Cryptolaemus montrouzieri]|uniref:R3H domain-containing protein n=1 Tax=Cryptolaemus montrouzieri TaxID=559131 RepID=A0ABD2NUB3_9CUCU